MGHEQQKCFDLIQKKEIFFQNIQLELECRMMNDGIMVKRKNQ